MSRFKPSPTQLAVLRAVAAGDCWEWSGRQYTDREHKRLPAPSILRLIREDLIEIGDHVRIPALGSIQHHKPVRLTVLGESLLATLDGAS